MNRIKAVISAGAIAAAAVAVTPVLTAQASYSECPNNTVCLWQNNSYSGDFLGYRAPNGGLRNISAANDNRTSSWANRTLVTARWYQKADGDGFCVTMGATSSKADMPDSENDKISSWATNRGC